VIFLTQLRLWKEGKRVYWFGKLLPITPEEVELLKVSFARNTYRIAKTWEHYQEKAKLVGML